MVLVTVNCLVCAMGSLVTVRSCVTWTAVPGADGGKVSDSEFIDDLDKVLRSEGKADDASNG